MTPKRSTSVQLGFTPLPRADRAISRLTILKIYVYGYLNRIQSSRRLARESHRNVELIWLTGRLMPDFKTIADFRKDNRQAIRRVCMEFVGVFRELKMEQLKGVEAEVEAHPDKQVSLTGPDARSMMKAGGGSSVGYNVQTAVDGKHYLIAAHEVTNAPTDRSQLAPSNTGWDQHTF